MMGNDEYKKKTLIISWNPFRELGKIISRFIGKEKKKEKKVIIMLWIKSVTAFDRA